MAQTIPSPSEDEIKIAMVGLRIQAGAAGLDWDSPEVQKFVKVVAENLAQHMAEVRWLRNMVHDARGLEEFLAQRGEKNGELV